MKNYILATFLLTLIVVGVLMGLYFLPSMSVGGKPLRKVDLLADIRPDVEEEVCDSDTIVLPPPVKPILWIHVKRVLPVLRIIRIPPCGE